MEDGKAPVQGPAAVGRGAVSRSAATHTSEPAQPLWWDTELATSRPRRLDGLLPALLGQLLALLVSVTAVCSTLLADQGLSSPTLQSSLNYLLLAVIFGSLQLRRRRPLSNHWASYLLLAVLDVEANFCLVLSFRWTSLTSVTLLDSFSIPVVVLLSSLVLRARYRRMHIAAAATCVLGQLVLVLGDKSSDAASSGSRPALGDCLVLLGASLYAACNVAQERLLGDAPPGELLAMLGLFGTVISAVQGLPLELRGLMAADWSAAVVLPLLGFTAAMLLLYTLIPHMLLMGGAALLNLSLLSSDIWAAGTRALFFGGFTELSGACFIIAFAIVAVGLGLFTSAGSVACEAAPSATGPAGRMSPGVPYFPVAQPGSSVEEQQGIELEVEDGLSATLCSSMHGSSSEHTRGRGSSTERQQPQPSTASAEHAHGRGRPEDWRQAQASRGSGGQRQGSSEQAPGGREPLPFSREQSPDRHA